MLDVSIVMPTHGRSGTVSRAIAALGAQRLDGNELELIVVADAAAAPETEQTARDAGAAAGLALRTARAQKPGAAAARNVGWRMAQAALVLFLDDDLLADPELVAEHLRRHRANPGPEVAVLGPVRWADEIRVTPFMRWLETGMHFDFDRIVGDEAGWGRLYTCNVSIKRELLERVGGLDEDEFPFHYEDLDLGRRMHDHGLRLLFHRAAGAQHLKRETIESWARRLPGVAAAEYRFVRRYPEVPPFFYELFHATLQEQTPRGRLAPLARIVGPRTPLIGRRVWASFDRICRHRLAPVFIAAWEEQVAAERAAAGPAPAGRSSTAGAVGGSG